MTEHTWSRLTWLTLLVALASAALLAAIGCVLPDTLHGRPSHHHDGAGLALAKVACAPGAPLQSRPLPSQALASAHVLRDRLRHLEFRDCHPAG